MNRRYGVVQCLSCPVRTVVCTSDCLRSGLWPAHCGATMRLEPSHLHTVLDKAVLRTMKELDQTERCKP
jgi:hypothetical protein